MKWLIIDWAGNIVFNGETFESFDDAEEFLCEKLDNDYELGREEYYIVQGTTRDGRYLETNHPMNRKKLA